MLAFHDFGSFLLMILGLAFLLVWQGERQHLAADYWGVSHLALALASVTGYRYQDQNHSILGLLALLCTGFFLITLYVKAYSVENSFLTSRSNDRCRSVSMIC